jgi:hypothetical protein
MSRTPSFAAAACVLAIGGFAIVSTGPADAAWQPAKPIEFIATAGPAFNYPHFRPGRAQDRSRYLLALKALAK